MVTVMGHVDHGKVKTCIPSSVTTADCVLCNDVLVSLQSRCCLPSTVNEKGRLCPC